MFRVPNIRLQTGVDFRQTRFDSPIIEGSPGKINEIGLYGHAETELNGKLRLVLAAREDFHQDYSAQFSPKAALIFRLDPQIVFRVTYNRAFRSPSIVHQRLQISLGGPLWLRGARRGFRFGTADGAPLPSEYADGIPKINPEENTTLELGFKGILASRLFLDLSGYHSLYKNFISPLRPIGDLANGIYTLDENGNPRVGEQTLTYLNFGKQTVLGLDMGLNFYATDRVVFKGNTSLIKARDLEAPAGLDQPFNTPTATVNLGLSAADILTKGVALDLALRRVSQFDFLSGVHVGTVPAYTVVDASLRYRIRKAMTYRLMVKNLFDNEHIEMVGGARIGRIALAEVAYGF